MARNREDACADLAEKSRHIFQKEWDEHRHVHENYNSITGEGCDAKNSDKFYHWGALMSVIALLEAQMIGDLDLSVQGTSVGAAAKGKK